MTLLRDASPSPRPLGSDDDANARLVRAEALSASALAASDYGAARLLFDEAKRLDPFNPMHTLRSGLLEMKFGQLQSALDVFDRLITYAPDRELPVYLRGLVMLHQGEPKRTVNTVAKLTFAPGRFLHVEAQFQLKLKSTAKQLAQLPRAAEHAALWLDLLAKLIVAHGKDGAALVHAELKRRPILPPQSREALLLQKLLRVAAADVDELEAALVADPPGSRSEELILLCYHDRLRELPDRRAALTRLGRLQAGHADRPALRRLYVRFLEHVAVEEASAERYHSALVYVERCRELEPFEAVHYQNRATIFTLLREKDAYHQSWLDLNRHLYRLCLFGKLGKNDVQRIIKLHRLFAENARMSRGGTGGLSTAGVFAAEHVPTRPKDQPTLVVNHQRIEQDPDLLRQWIFHRQAELFFRHVDLGSSSDRLLLNPLDATVARSRFDALTHLGGALDVLVADEGTLLREALERRWRAAPAAVVSSYAPPSASVDVDQTAREHLATIAELALLCATWRPPAKRPDLVELVLTFLKSEFAFFDEAELYAVIKCNSPEAEYSVRIFYYLIVDELQLGETEIALNDDQRTQVVASLSASLLTRMAGVVYEESQSAQNAADRALAFIDRARTYDVKSPLLEFHAARLLTIGRYYDEARQAVSRFYRFQGQTDSDLAAAMEEIQGVLEERRKEKETGRRRTGVELNATVVETPDDDLDSLLAAVDERPSSIQAYEQIVYWCVTRGRLDDAVDFSERAVSKCLSRRAQLRARNLNLEALGLRELAGLDAAAAALYARGVHHPALKAINDRPLETATHYVLHYLRGRCQLAIGTPQDAIRSFAAALGACDRPLHRVVLRRLAADVDEPYAELVRRSVGDRVQAGDFDAALAELAVMFRQLQRPEAALLELAGVLMSRAAADLASGATSREAPQVEVTASWNADLQIALNAAADLARVERLAELSKRLYEPGVHEAEVLEHKAQIYARQASVAAALARSTELLARDEATTALQALDELTWGAEQPRVLQQRAILLLHLERFDEAGELARRLADVESDVARQFVDRFPSLALQKRLQLAGALLRSGESARALEMLLPAQARAPRETVDLAYLRSFARSLSGYAARRRGESSAARNELIEALRLLEPCHAAAVECGHKAFLELFERLDADVERMSS